MWPSYSHGFRSNNNYYYGVLAIASLRALSFTISCWESSKLLQFTGKPQCGTRRRRRRRLCASENQIMSIAYYLRAFACLSHRYYVQITYPMHCDASGWHIANIVLIGHFMLVTRFNSLLDVYLPARSWRYSNYYVIPNAVLKWLRLSNAIFHYHLTRMTKNLRSVCGRLWNSTLLLISRSR